MSEAQRRSERTARIAAVILAAAIFITDLRLPLGASVAGLYVGVVLLGLWSTRGFTASAAVAVSLLTVIGAILSPVGPMPWMAAVNRPTALTVIWVAAIGVIRYKKNEARVLEERRQAQAYLDVAAVPIVALDDARRVVLINPKGCELVGRERSEVLGRDWVECFVPAGARQGARDILDGLRTGRVPEGARYDMPVLTARGEERLVEWRGTVAHDAAGEVSGTLSSGEDTTERRRAEALLASVLDSAPVTLLAVDRSGAVTVAEGTGFRQMGIDADELLGTSSQQRLEELPWLAGPLERALAGESSTAAGELHGTSYEVRATPLRDASRRVVGSLAVSLDVTERSRAEADLRRQQTLAKLGELAAVVAHEVRNPLAGIRATIQVLASRLPGSDQPTVKALFARIDALNAMTEDLLLFARPRPLRLAPLPIKDLLREAADLLAGESKPSGVAVAISGDGARVRGDGPVLRGVFLNLLLNAAQAMGGRGTIGVSVEAGEGTCRVSICDSGPGIAAELRERIFEPFFTTKHRGTGLGLAIVRRQVEMHGGEISVACPPEGGTTITVVLRLEPAAA